MYDLPICLGGRVRVTVMTKPVLSENVGKRILYPKHRFSNRFSETVKTNPVLSQEDEKRILRQTRRFSNRFS